MCHEELLVARHRVIPAQAGIQACPQRIVGQPVHIMVTGDWSIQPNQHIGFKLARPRAYFGHKIICVQRNSASVRPLASSLTTASHTCVLRPRCWALATQATAPSVTVPR